MQTILGAGGSIGQELAKELSAFTNQIRLVSRNPQKVNPTDELFPADLPNQAQIDKAVAGSEVVYITVGFAYDIKVWREKWPALMKHTIDACKKHKAKLVFFDNVYMYDRTHLYHMTEETPVKPSSKKGEVRAQIAGMLMDEVNRGSLTALIARSADFLGPKNSIIVETVYKNLLAGKKADWFADTSKLHSYTFTPDAAKATAILGNTPDAYNQVWHLPTSKPLTGKQWVELFAKEMGVKPDVRAVPLWLLGILGLFKPIMKELHEMAYQYDRDYVFKSDKFEKRFNFRPISPEEGVKTVIEMLQK
ncbi:NAD(P)H-binding protein [Rhodocytophaga rosea]|uniref:NAD(P)H-binding protein n=1 Tax=Rhodocytophaga rosea TaxID=2704465 RepID=A0A6C0GQY2_9BACT|nr:NAD(P)H-binding protein [Rhodocytophaga rosea]QHT70476.1 NAD(P)H-binding protein [Rhodocytophaga rosea]